MRKFLGFGAIVAALAVSPAQAEVVDQKASSFVTRDSVTVSADLRETWLRLISPNKWWNEAHTFSGDSANLMLRPQAGGCFCETIPAKEDTSRIGLAGSVEHMRVILAMPDQALRMRGALGPLQSEPVNGVLTVTIAETEKGTRIVFEYAVDGYMRYETGPISTAVDNVITQQMMGLAEDLGPLEGESKEQASSDDEQPAEEQEAESDVPEEAEEEAEPKISVDEAFGDLTKDE